MTRARLALLPVFLLLLAVTTACTSTVTRQAATGPVQWTAPTKKIVLIEPDVELGELTAGGLVEPRADWTANAKRHIYAHAGKLLAAKGVELTQVEQLTSPRDIQLSKLHSVVGMAALLHTYNSAYQLPHKGSALDWTLGPGTNDMRLRHGADYGLFLYVRDSYTTAGRALMMAGALVLGVYIPGGTQVAFASLVDLSSGKLVWFNQLASEAGDLRTEEPAAKVVDNLLGKLPL